MIHRAEVICPGAARGSALRLDAPISFWGGVSAETARITLAGHPQIGECVTGRVLIAPSLVGSSSSSAVLLELLHKRIHPLAIVLGERDAILSMGVVVSAEMGWPTLPIFLLPDPPFASGDDLELFPDGGIAVGGR